MENRDIWYTPKLTSLKLDCRDQREPNNVRDFDENSRSIIGKIW